MKNQYITTDLKEFINKTPSKSPIDTQLFTDCNCLLNDVIFTINENMSNDLKQEFGYDFIKLLREIMICFAKSYLYKDNELKQKYADSIYDITIDIDVYLNIFEVYKKSDKSNKLGISTNKLLELRKAIGKIELHFEKWRISIYTKHNEETNNKKIEKLADLYNGLN